MFRILIVDDEPSVVHAISQTMPWAELDIEEVFCAYSALEALRVVEREFIDIVLTDIRMPSMDGIELMQRIGAIASRVRFILLTGYAEFEYAQQALRLQATDYLLKPVRDEILEEAIRKLTVSLREEWSEVSSQRSTIQYVKEHLPTLQADLLRNTLEGVLPLKELEEKLQLLSLPYEADDIVYTVVVRMEWAGIERTDRPLLEYSMLNIAEEVMEPQYHLWHCKDIHGYLVMVLKVKDGMEGIGADAVSRLLSQWQHLVLNYAKVNISLVYGSCERFPYDLLDVYESALKTLRRRIGDDTGLLLKAGERDITSVLRTASHLQAPPSISHLFSAGLWSDAMEKLESIFIEVEQAEDTLVHVDFLAEIYHTVLSACYHYAHKNGQSIAQALQCEGDLLFYQSPELIQSVSLLRAWSHEVCQRLSLSNRDEIRDVRDSLIKKIQEYIHVHLAEDVSLQALANHVNMHPVYLSKVYKLGTGEGLKDYLFRIRMERAVHLLNHKDLKVYEIASQIGYMNTAYFIKVFKRMYGVTPQEYRG